MVNSDTDQAYPLHWPAGWKRSLDKVANNTWKRTVDKYRREMLHEIELLGGKNVVVSTNVPLRKDGNFYADFRTPEDCGVAVYFNYRGRPVCFACDKYTRITWNCHAIGLTIAAMRQIERCGASDMLERAFTGFAALPERASSSWRVALGFKETQVVSLAEAESAFRDLAKTLHSDQGGNDDLMRGLLDARSAARTELGGQR